LIDRTVLRNGTIRVRCRDMFGKFLMTKQTKTMKPRDFLEFKAAKEAEIDALREQIEAARQWSQSSPPPEGLRPARREDVVVGAILWEETYFDEETPTGWRWLEVEEVVENERESDPWIFFMSEGCLSDARGCFVEE
jgi:hypothetical protein